MKARTAVLAGLSLVVGGLLATKWGAGPSPAPADGADPSSSSRQPNGPGSDIDAITKTWAGDWLEAAVEFDRMEMEDSVPSPYGAHESFRAAEESMGRRPVPIQTVELYGPAPSESEWQALHLDTPLGYYFAEAETLELGDGKRLIWLGSFGDEYESMSAVVRVDEEPGGPRLGMVGVLRESDVGSQWMQVDSCVVSLVQDEEKLYVRYSISLWPRRLDWDGLAVSEVTRPEPGTPSHLESLRGYFESE